MLKLPSQFFLTGTELGIDDTVALLALARELKIHRGHVQHRELCAGKQLALLFDKPSLRTRLSFTVAMRELGGDVVESNASSSKMEEPEDQMRVLQGYCHAVMIRTHDDHRVERMSQVAKIPLINGLTDLHHPCQILADLLTIQEHFNTLDEITLTYMGDGNNILHSLLLMAPRLGIHLRYCCPPEHGPNALILKQAQQCTAPGSIQAFQEPLAAVQHTQVVYTDVWTSMGFNARDPQLFAAFQVNETLLEGAADNVIFMHCMPMNRGKEVSKTLPDAPNSVIFQQSENRLHVQKALLVGLLTEN